MTQEEIIEMANQVGASPSSNPDEYDVLKITYCELEAFAKLVAEKEREVVANWIMDRGFATGHGDSIVDLLDQLEWQIAEKEREECAEVCDDIHAEHEVKGVFSSYAEAIRARGQA